MNSSVLQPLYLYGGILLMGAVTYAIRVLPITLIRRPIRSRFLRSFLFYAPYVTLAVMVFPSILSATELPLAAAAGFLSAVFLSWKTENMMLTSIGSCIVVFLLECCLC